MSSIAQIDIDLEFAFENIEFYRENGNALEQVCEMMNTENLLGEMNLNQAEKGKYYMKICLTEVALDSIEIDGEVLGRALEYKGIRHYVYSEFDQAVSAFEASLEILREYGLQYRIHRWLGIIHCLSEHLSLGIKHYEDAIFFAMKYYGEQDPQGDAFIFSLHSNVTSAYAKLENFRKAKYHAQLAHVYADKLTDKSLIATAAINEANILVNEKKALAALNILFSIDSIVTDDMQIAANYYNILGSAYQQTKSYDLSIENFKKSNDLISKTSVLQESMILNLLAIAEAQYLKKSFKAALETTQDVIEELENKSNQFYSSLADAYHLKSKCLIELEAFDRAEQAVLKALEIEGPFETWKLPQLSTIISVKAAQFEETQDQQNLVALMRFQVMSDSLILDLQVKHRHYEDEIKLNEYIYNVYSDNLKIISKLRNDFPEKFGPEMIFKYMETLKSLRLRKERKANIDGLNIPSDLLNQLSELKYTLIQLQKSKYEKEQLNQDVSAIDSTYASTKYHYYAMLDILEAEYPQYYKGQYQKVNSDLSKVQRILKQDEIIIEYFLSDKTIYTIGISTDSFYFKSVPKPENWEERIDGFRQVLHNTDYINQPDKYQEIFELFSQHAEDFYVILLEELILSLPIDIKLLKIIPDNELYYIPFEILLTSGESALNYHDLSYLGQSYNISYSESTEYLFQANNQIYDKQYTVIAPKYLSSKKDLKELPNSYQSAIRTVDKLNGYLISDDDESSTYFTSKPSTNVLHFAGHATITEDPSLSKLILEGGAIYASDIYQSEIKNQLTILSACNTGSGDIINGRGLQSLSRAFRFAGAQSTIQSLWSVPDLQTAKINKEIFFHLEAGMNIQDALQKAKFNLLHDSPMLYSHPFYWAGFVTFGSTNKKMIFGRNEQSIYLYLGFIFLIGFIWYLLCMNRFFLRKKDKSLS